MYPLFTMKVTSTRRKGSGKLIDFILSSPVFLFSIVITPIGAPHKQTDTNRRETSSACLLACHSANQPEKTPPFVVVYIFKIIDRQIPYQIKSHPISYHPIPSTSTANPTQSEPPPYRNKSPHIPKKRTNKQTNQTKPTNKLCSLSAFFTPQSISPNNIIETLTPLPTTTDRRTTGKVR